MSKQIIKSLKEWLGKEGSPLEMHVASLFQDNNYNVIQSDFYFDDDEKKYREIDLLASKNITIAEKEIGLGITFIIESKSSVEKPWLLLSSDKLNNCPHSGLISSKSIANKKGEFLLSNIDLINELPKYGFINGPKKCAYSVITAFRKKDNFDLSYNACMSVSKATYYFKKNQKNIGQILFKEWLQIWFPIIIVESKLFIASLNQENKIDIIPVNYGRLKFKNPNAISNELIIDIVPNDNLNEYLKMVDNEMSTIEKTVRLNPAICKEGSISIRKTLEKLKKDNQRDLP